MADLVVSDLKFGIEGRVLYLYYSSSLSAPHILAFLLSKRFFLLSKRFSLDDTTYRYGGGTGGGRAKVRCWYGVTLGWHRGGSGVAVWQW